MPINKPYRIILFNSILIVIYRLGQGSGVVNSGPFSGWITPVSPLRRDIARGIGSLVTLSRIDTVMSFCRLGASIM
jgi:hypothetical protein